MVKPIVNQKVQIVTASQPCHLSALVENIETLKIGENVKILIETITGDMVRCFTSQLLQPNTATTQVVYYSHVIMKDNQHVIYIASNAVTFDYFILPNLDV